MTNDRGGNHQRQQATSGVALRGTRHERESFRRYAIKEWNALLLKFAAADMLSSAHLMRLRQQLLLLLVV